MERISEYPVHPRVELSGRVVRVVLDGTVVAESTRAWRVLERGHPPSWYVPPQDVRAELLRPAADARETFCEWKGVASYYDVEVGGRVAERAAWFYPEPTAPFAEIAGALAFYPATLECSVDGERVQPENRAYYGGWFTADVSRY